MRAAFDTEYLGRVTNTEHIDTVVAVPGASLVLGSTAIGTYVGLVIGGEIGAAVGGLASTAVANLAWGEIHTLAVELNRHGQVNLKYMKRRHRVAISN